MKFGGGSQTAFTRKDPYMALSLAEYYLTPVPPLVPDVRLLAIAANVSRSETAEAVSDVFIRLGSLTLLFWNTGLDAMLDVDVVVVCDVLAGTSR